MKLKMVNGSAGTSTTPAPNEAKQRTSGSALATATAQDPRPAKKRSALSRSDLDTSTHLPYVSSRWRPPRLPTAYEVREPPISASVPMTITATSPNLFGCVAAMMPARANVISEEIGMQHASTKAKTISARYPWLVITLVRKDSMPKFLQHP